MIGQDPSIFEIGETVHAITTQSYTCVRNEKLIISIHVTDITRTYKLQICRHIFIAFRIDRAAVRLQNTDSTNEYSVTNMRLMVKIDTIVRDSVCGTIGLSKLVNVEEN